MQKQHFTSQVARLVNPPLLSQFKQLQQDNLERIYASKTAPLGQGKPPSIPPEAVEKGFGVFTEKGDSAATLIHPSNCRTLYSIYGREFLPPYKYPCEEFPPAGISNKATGDPSEQVKKDFSESGKQDGFKTETKEFPTVPGSSLFTPNENEVVGETEYKSNFRFCQDGCCREQSEQNALLRKQMNLKKSFKNLLNISDPICFKKFYFFLKSQLENFPQNISIAEFQGIILNFGVCVTICQLRRFLLEFDLIGDCSELINVQNFLDVLNWKSSGTESMDIKRSSFLQNKTRIFGTDDNVSTNQFKKCYDVYKYADYLKYIELQRPAGIPTIRNDFKKPKLKSVADFTEYGDIKNGSCVIQPDVFEGNGIYDDDLFALRSKNEIISILRKSGVCFQIEMFDLVWEKLNVEGKASIGNIWNSLKHLCLMDCKVT